MRMKNRNSTSTRCPLLHGLARLPDFFVSCATCPGHKCPHCRPRLDAFRELGFLLAARLVVLAVLRSCLHTEPDALACCRPGARRARQGPARLAALPEKAARWHKASSCAGQRHTGTDTGRVQAWPAAGCQSDAFRHHSCRFPRDACQQTHHQPCLQPRHAPVSPLVTGPARCRTVQEVFVPCGKSLPCLRPSFLP